MAACFQWTSGKLNASSTMLPCRSHRNTLPFSLYFASSEQLPHLPNPSSLPLAAYSPALPPPPRHTVCYTELLFNLFFCLTALLPHRVIPFKPFKFSFALALVCLIVLLTLVHCPSTFICSLPLSYSCCYYCLGVCVGGS